MVTRRSLGRTNIEISTIGISSSFGAGEEVYHEAFERGCNYFTWGTFIKGRSGPFRRFWRSMTTSGKREDIVLGLLSYSHSSILGERFLTSALRQLGTEYIDGLLLGYYSSKPPRRILDWALEEKHRGRVRAIGMTTHNRAVVPPLAAEGEIDYFHIRYNAAHRGAEEDIFPKMEHSGPAGLVAFTATCWGRLLDPGKAGIGGEAPTAGDCYRFVLSRQEVSCCMMGVKTIAMLRENLAELEKGAMTEREYQAMRKAGDRLYRTKRGKKK